MCPVSTYYSLRDPKGTDRRTGTPKNSKGESNKVKRIETSTEYTRKSVYLTFLSSQNVL